MKFELDPETNQLIKYIDNVKYYPVKYIKYKEYGDEINDHKKYCGFIPED